LTFVRWTCLMYFQTMWQITNYVIAIKKKGKEAMVELVIASCVLDVTTKIATI